MQQCNKNDIELIWHMAIAEIKAETARGYMGALWWILEPVMYMGAFYIVFAILKQRGEDMIAFLLCGLVVWKWFASSLGQGSNSIAAGAGLMRQVYIPKFVFPGVSLLSNVLKFLVVFALLLLFLLVYGAPVTQAWFALPVLLLMQFVMMAALVSLLAAIVPFVPDLKAIISNGMMVLFFLSGVLFDISKAPEQFQPYLYLNPMVIMIESYRMVLLQGLWPNWGGLLLMLLISIAGLVLSAFLLARFDRVYPKVLLR